MPERIRKTRWRRVLSLAGIAAMLLLTFSYTWAASRNNGGRTGKELYNAACAACHGEDGQGTPQARVGFDIPLPDLTDCNFATREPNLDWHYVAARGGPARAFDRMMPAFFEALTDEEITRILNYIRTFCGDDAWPRGEFNLPRALVTTKAYPEDEVVLSSSVQVAGRDRIENELIFEKRFGARNQFELILPFGWNEKVIDDNQDTEWRTNLGDVGLGLKRVMYHNLDTGMIISLGGEAFFPTGNENNGFGSETAFFETYVSYGQLLPEGFFFQFQGGAGFPADSQKGSDEVFARGVFGKTFVLGKYGYQLSPMVEVLGSREMHNHANTHWDLAPQVQIPLNRRQHVRLCVGAQIPMNYTRNRDTVYSVYLLWDWFDGGFFQGW